MTTLSMEDAFVTGALQVSEDGASSRAAIQGSDEGALQGSPFRRTSLEALALAPSVAHVRLPENQDAISTALPNSIDEESNQEYFDACSVSSHHLQFQESLSNEPDVPGSNVAPAVESYASTVEILSSYLPHLDNVRSSGRHNKVSVTCYNYSDDVLASVIDFTENPSRELQNGDGTSLRRYLEDSPPENIHLRVIVASDLSTDLIECLGTSFSISPEVYEEHLVNSGWKNGSYNDGEPNTWITRDMQKSHMSIKWYRPVKRVLQVDRQRLLDSRAQSFSWKEAVPNGLQKPHGVDHVSKPATNILRQDWDITTDVEATVAVGGFTAWEERATVWSTQCAGYRVAVVLLDPLPIIKDEIKGAAEVLRKLGVDLTPPATIRQVTDEGSVEDDITGSSATDHPPSGLVKSSTFVRPKPNQNFSLVSLGRLMFRNLLQPQDSSRDAGPSAEEPGKIQATEDPESGALDRERQQKNSKFSRPRARNGVVMFLRGLFRGSREKTEVIDRNDEIDVLEEKEGTEIKTLKPMDRCMFEGLYPRGPAYDYDFMMDPKNVEILAKHLDSTKPTAADLAAWLTHDQSRLTVGPTTLLECIFGIIQADTVNTLGHMQLALREIGQNILDDTLIQQRLLRWRLLLTRFGTELQQMEDSLRRFAEFIDKRGFSQKNNTEDPDTRNHPVEKLLKDSISQINSIRQHTTRSHKSLMANMSIVESKRGIAEAESVTKLTELAFFFIPLTFSASIFSMQVKELNASQTSIVAFFILAVIITTASYALRLVIRSERFINFRRKVLSDIRHDTGLASGSSIPTKVFIGWLWRRVGLLTIIVAILVVLLVTPIAVLWTKDIDHGFKILLTILLLAFIVSASYVIGNAMLYIDTRGLHLRRDIFKPGAKYKERPYQTPLNFSNKMALIYSWLSNRWVLIGVTVTGVGAGPSAALWTSQVTIGIKVGATIVIGMLYVGFIVFLVMWQLPISLSRNI